MELLSPAGSFDALRAAVSAGCDAVYMGSSEFANARMNAANFDKTALSAAIDYCRIRGVKTYITVNTLLTDREIGQLFDYAVFLYENGADGVIVQDLGVMRFLRKNVPCLPLHASTQMGICSLEGVKFAEQIGCTRAVVARELSKENIDFICKNSGIEIEVFVHGAMCSSVSGYCLMSSFIGRRSGNRGKCAQPCRLTYVSGGKSGCLMSLKDMMLINHIGELEKSGVASLKIEGRMKSPGYVGTVTEVYRKAIDGADITDADIRKLLTAFDRGGCTDAYYTGGKDLFAINKPETAYGEKNYEKPEKKIGISVFAKAEIGKPFAVRMCADGKSFSAAAAALCEKAVKRETTAEDIRKKVDMLGETPFFCENFSAEVEPNVMVPVSEIKSVRRHACSGLLELLTEKKNFDGKKSADFIKPFVNRNGFKLSVSVTTLSQYRAANAADAVYVPLSLLAKNKKAFMPHDRRITVVLPKVCHDDKREISEKMIADAENMGYRSFCAANYADCEKAALSDYPLWCYNSEAAQGLSELGMKRICLSPEMNIAQIKALKSPVPCEAAVYGKLPLMTSVNCFAKNSGTCGECYLKDRSGAVFELLCDKELGIYEVLNSVPVYMADKLSDFENTCVDMLRLVFTTETADECKEIIEKFKNGEKPRESFTRGHYYRGV